MQARPHVPADAAVQPTLFDVGPAAPVPAAPAAGAPRLRVPVRDQAEFRPVVLDELLPADHRARMVWEHVRSLDLSPLLDRLLCRGSSPGHPAADPRVLVSLWLFATLEGVGSARLLARLCDEGLPYRWICGGVSMNPHTLSDFRVADAGFLDGLLVRSVAVLMEEGLVTLDRVACDGMRVRAEAGAASFHRRPTLERHLAEATEQVRVLREEVADDPAGSDRRRRSAARRGAEDRAARLTEALRLMAEIEAKPVSDKPVSDKPAEDKPAEAKPAEVKPAEAKPAEAKPAEAKPAEAKPAEAKPAEAKPAEAKPAEAKPAGKKMGKKDKEPRVSSTDPQARVMKMGDGGYRPAFNVQFGTDTASRVIVRVDVTDSGSDAGELAPTVADINADYGKAPAEVLADGQYATHADIAAVAGPAFGCTVYAPVPEPRDPTRDRHAPLPGDSPEVAAWRTRMGTEAAKAIYRDRASTAECVNAQARNRGLVRTRVRGLERVRCMALWFALAHLAARAAALRAESATKQQAPARR